MLSLRLQSPLVVFEWRDMSVQCSYALVCQSGVELGGGCRRSGLAEAAICCWVMSVLFCVWSWASRPVITQHLKLLASSNQMISYDQSAQCSLHHSIIILSFRTCLYSRLHLHSHICSGILFHFFFDLMRRVIGPRPQQLVEGNMKYSISITLWGPALSRFKWYPAFILRYLYF